MKASELFNKLGYFIDKEESIQNHIVYKKCNDNTKDCNVIIFYPDHTYLITYRHYYVDEYGEEFYEWVIGVDMELNRAIQQQLKEFNWV